MTEENEPVMGSGREKISRGDPDAVDEITILDYVMLDFAEGSFASRKNVQRGTETEPWGHDDQEGILAEA